MFQDFNAKATFSFLFQTYLEVLKVYIERFEETAETEVQRKPVSLRKSSVLDQVEPILDLTLGELRRGAPANMYVCIYVYILYIDVDIIIDNTNNTNNATTTHTNNDTNTNATNTKY